MEDEQYDESNDVCHVCWGTGFDDKENFLCQHCWEKEWRGREPDIDEAKKELADNLEMFYDCYCTDEMGDEVFEGACQSARKKFRCIEYLIFGPIDAALDGRG